jgi:hypothetical protein
VAEALVKDKQVDEDVKRINVVGGWVGGALVQEGSGGRRPGCVSLSCPVILARHLLDTAHTRAWLDSINIPVSVPLGLPQRKSTRELSGSTQEEKYNLRVKIDASEQNVRVSEWVGE